MRDSTLVDIILAADNSDDEDLFLRAALAITLLGMDERIFGRPHDCEDGLAA
jgi:hypothetical protein